MNRRGFLRFLGAGAIAAADPERLVWTPGRRLISIPRTLSVDSEEFARRYFTPLGTAMHLQMQRDYNAIITQAIETFQRVRAQRVR